MEGVEELTGIIVEEIELIEVLLLTLVVKIIPASRYSSELI